MKIVTIIGARPQFIKAAAVSRVLRASDGMDEILVHTGQHYDANMSDVFFDELEIPRPDYHLGIGSASHGAQTGRMLEGIEQVVLERQPDWVLVYGDTNSTLAGALAAVKLHIPVAHVEAGLRSFNRRMPEEINRVLTDQVSDLLFTPTEVASAHLRREGIPEARIHLVGDVMYDASLFYREKARQQTHILARLGLTPQSYVLATVHRAENTDDPHRLREIFTGLQRVAEHMPVVLPLHPRTRHIIEGQGLTEQYLSRLTLIDPVGYLEMVALEESAFAITTDSGGVQKEAFFYRVPCVTLRDETEWVETVEAGANQLVGADADRLAHAIERLIDHPPALPDPGPYYGEGHASTHIVHTLTP
jgi:UDP-GlcNAc3NAcA epimerase